jgi:hypothetical protein
MPEWPNGIDSKSIVVAIPPRVRIPVSPPSIKPNLLSRLGFFVVCLCGDAIQMNGVGPLIAPCFLLRVLGNWDISEPMTYRALTRRINNASGWLMGGNSR